MEKKKRTLSGMRPTGKLHLGHLVGALSNWVKLQDEYDCFFMIADWHALMSEYENPKLIKQNSIECAIDWLACGINPDKSTIFVQSDVKEHCELHMILSIITQLAVLERCPTYKEQLREQTKRDLTTYGFLGYPVLQAADILLYKSDVVPVGMDQLPHLELTRLVARKFNNLYGKIFKEPKPLLTKISKLMGLDNRKMSKSYENFIALSDDEETVKKKIATMFTDPKRVRLSDPGHPDTCNVYNYFKIFKPILKEEIHDYCLNAKVGCTECKKNLAGAITEYLNEVQKKRKKILQDKQAIDDILDKGAEKARSAASETMNEVRRAVGLKSGHLIV